jgi:putative transposase
MPRPQRRYRQGEIHHVINRANERETLFFDEGDYRTFIDLLAHAVSRANLGLAGYCVMPNHWHLVIVTSGHRDLSRGMQWLTGTHAQRWSRSHPRRGPGHVYQGRFKSTPVQYGINLCRLLRYVERNALAAGLVSRAEAWQWGSAFQRHRGAGDPPLLPQTFLPPDQWLEHVNAPVIDREIGNAIRRNLPIGDSDWIAARREELRIRAAGKAGRPAIYEKRKIGV